jgi:hypothetical protein
MIIRNKESGETIEVMDGSIIAESAWEVVEPEPASDEEESVEASDDKDSKIESDTEVEAEDTGKSKKK